MATGSYSNLFIVIATSAATLIGLLFVALSVSERSSGARPRVVRQFRAAASFLAFINALTVTLFGLVPGTNVGYPALVLGVTGFELAFGIVLINNINDAPAIANIGYILISSLLIGIARAWELVGDWNTSILSSIMLLVGPSPEGGADAGPGVRDKPAAGDLDGAPGDRPE
jgi:hypothetical protein